MATNNFQIVLIDDSTEDLTWKNPEGSAVVYEAQHGVVINHPDDSYDIVPWGQIKRLTVGQ